MPRKIPQFWTFSQLKTLLGLSVILLTILGIEVFRKPIVLPDPPPGGSLAGKIQDRLDPNTASAVELAAIPNLGEARARMIIEYRDAFMHQHPGITAFRSSDDLMCVKGIGPAISFSLEPFLSFDKR